MRGDDARPDDGYVLASVIGMMTVLLLVVPMVLAATMSMTGWATAQRAAVQARAAAEAGIDVARAAFAAGGSWCSVDGTLSSSFTDPSYDVRVYSSSSGPATASGSPTCPTTGGSFTTESVLLVSTGRASTPGVGNRSGDTRVVEARLDLSVPGGAGGSVGSGRFPYTVLAREGLSGRLAVTGPDGGGDAAVAVAGSVTCDVLEIAGPLAVGGDLTTQSTDCHVRGNLVVGGDLVCQAGLVVEGDLSVSGDARFESGACQVLGTVVVGGDVVLTATDVPLGSVLAVGGGLDAQGLPADSVTTVAVGGAVTGPLGEDLADRWGGRLTTADPSVPVPEAFPQGTVDDRPGVRADDADLTEEFVEGDWREVVSAALAPGHTVSDLCHLTGAGSAFAGPVVIAQATRFDTRDACPTGISLGQGLRLDLGADAVLVADGITQTGDVEIAASGAGQHSLYLVDPWPDDPAATCDPLSTENGIDLAYGTWDQGPGAAVLLSTHRGARIASSPTGLAGQVDACTVDLPAAVSLTHASVSDSAAIDVSGFAVWDLAYVRDRS